MTPERELDRSFPFTITSGVAHLVPVDDLASRRRTLTITRVQLEKRNYLRIVANTANSWKFQAIIQGNRIR
jgi:hypothetical protein